MLEYGKIWHRKATCPTIHCFHCDKKGHNKGICFNYKLATIQKTPTTPKPKEMCLENNEQQEEGLITLCFAHPVKQYSRSGPLAIKGL